MSNDDIIRAWKDDDHRSELSPEEQSKLPDNPAGETELSEEELRQIQGGFNPGDVFTTLTITIGPIAPREHD